MELFVEYIQYGGEYNEKQMALKPNFYVLSLLQIVFARVANKFFNSNLSSFCINSHIEKCQIFCICKKRKKRIF